MFVAAYFISIDQERGTFLTQFILSLLYFPVHVAGAFLAVSYSNPAVNHPYISANRVGIPVEPV